MSAHDRPFGGMTWSIKESLLGYVSRAGGEITIAGDIESNQGSFTWPLRSLRGHINGENLEFGFGGRVLLQAHEGLFSVEFSGLSVHLRGNELLLASSGISNEPFIAGSYRTQIISGGIALISDEPRLLPCGEEAFGWNYVAGTPFDPFIIIFDETDWPATNDEGNQNLEGFSFTESATLTNTK